MSPNNSLIREVPDTQELWLDADGFSSIVVDLCERGEGSDEQVFENQLDDILGERGSGESGEREGMLGFSREQASKMP